MIGDDEVIEYDALLAAVLRGEVPAWPIRADAAAMLERVLYHGIAGLIVEQARNLSDWPDGLVGQVREQAIAQAMWEMRHKPLLETVLSRFADAGIRALLLKGSALAYDLYAAPAARARGDSDVLIAADNLAAARAILSEFGFERDTEGVGDDDLALQEVWHLDGDDGLAHLIDLHWQLLNAPALAGVMPFGECIDNPLALPRLGREALAMSRPATLLHTCIHRAMHITTPYFVGGVTYHGGDRMIWVNDIDLLAGALSPAEWDDFVASAIRQGVAEVALDGLDIARRILGTAIPAAAREQLGKAEGEAASAYLLSAGQAGRSWRDLSAIAGWRRKLAYAAGRALPSANFMRAKYPGMHRRPLAMLYARRAIDLVRPRRARARQE